MKEAIDVALSHEVFPMAGPSNLCNKVEVNSSQQVTKGYGWQLGRQQ